MFKEGKSFDEVKKVVEGGIESFDEFNRLACEIGKRKDLDKDDVIDLLNCTDFSCENKYQKYFKF